MSVPVVYRDVGIYPLGYDGPSAPDEYAPSNISDVARTIRDSSYRANVLGWPNIPFIPYDRMAPLGDP